MSVNRYATGKPEVHMEANYLVLAPADRNIFVVYDSFEGADDCATREVRSNKEDRYVYKLHKIYRPESTKYVPEIVYVDP